MKARCSVLAISMLLVFLVTLFPARGEAQEEGVKKPVEHNQVISTNPITDMFTWFNGEFERKIAPTSTMGLAGSYISFEGGDETFKSGNVFYRYYPQGAALTGFFFGGRFGVYGVEDIDESATFYGFGIDLGYSWLLGASRAFSLSLGIGAVRLFGGDLENVALTLPTIRIINVGIAF